MYTKESVIRRVKKLQLKYYLKPVVNILSYEVDADEYLKNALFSEIKIMQSIKSENIVGFFDVMESSKNYYLVQ